MSKEEPTVIAYSHATSLFNHLSINLAWVTEAGTRHPILEVYLNCGRGPDLTKKFLLNIEGDKDRIYSPGELREFANKLIEGADKIEHEMRERCQACDENTSGPHGGPGCKANKS